MRASAISVEHTIEEQQAVRSILDTNGLKASMVMGNVPLAANNAEAPDCLRNITPHLDLAERLGAALVRIMLQSEADIPHAQRAADEAAERGITLAQQTHWGTLCETVEESLDVVRRMDRQNFGITFEPANLLACGDNCVPGALRRFAPNIVISTSKTSASIPMGRIPSIAAMPAQHPSPTWPSTMHRVFRSHL